MKIFRVDTSLKHINFTLDGKEYSIHFRDNVRKGVHDVSVWVDGNESPAHITGKYPPLKKVLVDLWKIHFPLWLRFKAHQRCKNR